MTTTLLILTLNEIDGLKVIWPQIKPEWCDQIIIVDGGSTDGTIEFAKSLGVQVVEQKRPGVRHAYLESLPYIKCDVIIPFSPDGNSIASNIPILISEIHKGFDMVVCSRYLANAKSDDDDIVTAFGNRLFTFLINFTYGSRYTDTMVMYRAFKKQLIYDLHLNQDLAFWPEKLFKTNICLIPLLSIRAALAKYKISEVPGDEPPRIGGERKLKIIRWGSAYLLQILTDQITWRIQKLKASKK